MATIIDSLMVTIGLDPKAFKKGAKEVEDAQAKLGKGAAKGQGEADKAAKAAAENMARFRNEILRTAAALVGLNAIKSFVSNVTSSDSALGRMANNLDTSVGALSNWENAARLAGGSAEGMAGDMRGLVQTVQRFSLTGEGGESLKYFRALGVNVADAHGKMRDMGDVMLDLADKFQGMDPAKAQALGAGLGLSESTINLLEQGRAGVQAYLDAAAQANTRTAEDVKNAQERQKAWLLLTETFKRLATDVLNFVSPALVGLMNLIRDNAPAAAALLGGVTVAMTAMSAVRFAGVLNSLMSLAGGMTATATGASGLIGLLGKGGLVAAAGLAAFGIARVVSKLTHFDDLMESLGSKIYDWTHDDISMAGGYVPGTIKGLGNMGRAAGAPSGNQPRGIRNNNPGNLEFAGQSGATREQGGGGRFAAFSSMAEGLAALAAQLQRYGSKGIDSVQAIISKYAPAGENNTAAYIASVAKRLGVGAGSHLNLKDPNVMRELMAGITTVENGAGRVSLAQINAGIDLYRQRGMGGTSSTSSTSNATHVGTMQVVLPNARDADGMVTDLRRKLSHQNLALQANQGLAS